MSLIHNITVGRFIPGEAALYRLDPRLKIAASAILLGSLLASDSTPILLVSVLVLVVVGKQSRLPVRIILGNLKPLVPILLLTGCLNARFTPGISVFALPIGLGELTEEGIARGFFLMLRLCVIVLGMALLTMTTSPLELTDGLESLFSPLHCVKLPVHSLAITLTIALRFVPILLDEADRLYKSQLARGADFGGGPIRRIRSLPPFLLPLFISAFSKADRLAIAIEARCYRGDRNRTRFSRLAFTCKDYIALTCVLVATGLILATNGL